jgi:hypothetical protein
MSSDGSITRAWGDGEHRFRLRIGELRELEAKREAGAFEIYSRLASGSWRVDDIVEVLRLGLIGGGVAPVMALGLTAKYVTPTAFLENVVAAREVLLCALFGDPADMVGKVLTAAGTETPAEKPGSPSTSAPAPPWDGRFATSTSVLSGNSLPPLTDGADAMAPLNRKHLA